MINTLEYLAADPYTRRVMEEQDFAAKNVEFWKNTIATVTAERDNAWSTINQQSNTIAAQAQELEAYRRMYGSLTQSPN